MADPVTLESATFQVYKEYLLDLGRIGDRHQTLRTFYITLLGALTGLLVLAGGDKAVFPTTAKLNTGLLVCGAGFAVCIMWCLHMGSFGALFDAKFEALRSMEKNLSVQPFTTENTALKGTRYRHLTTIDQIVAAVLAVAFAGLIAIGMSGGGEVHCCEVHAAPS